jgi:release factor glutamine methyltransferase
MSTHAMMAGVAVPDWVVERLERAGCVAAPEEAEEMVAAAPDAATLAGWVERRERGEPLAWITGTVWFCGRPLRLDPGVYVPRAQTEDLARRAAALLPEGGRAADLCTGCGAVATHLAAQVPGARMAAVDLDPGAARCARRNGVAAAVGDLAAAPLRPGAFDLVTAVAPYVPTAGLAYLPADVQRWEPRRALDGGDDGLDLVRRVVAAAAGLLRPGGWLALEVGGAQDGALAPTLATHAFAPATAWHDEDGDLRGLAARRAP